MAAAVALAVPSAWVAAHETQLEAINRIAGVATTWYEGGFSSLREDAFLYDIADEIAAVLAADTEDYIADAAVCGAAARVLDSRP